MGKSLVESKSFWGFVATVIPAASDAINQALGSGFLPPQITPWLVLGGGLLGILGRITASEPIESVLPKSE